ncbi:hypothetical protein BGZ83_009243 [Gryganskiella cystojenkinii]|nr:hypothetical protein BGZ83_009243 [Gryganskiella cystojenkinii]
MTPARIASSTLSRSLPRSVIPSTTCSSRMVNVATTRINTKMPRVSTITTARMYSSSASSGEKSRMVPVVAGLLILGGLTMTAAGLWQFYTSGVNAFPEGIRSDLRKALYYQNYGDDREKAVDYYRSALNAAMHHPDLKVDGPEVTGIMIQFGTMFQDMGRTQEAIDVLVMAFECLVHGRTMGTGNSEAMATALSSSEEDNGFDGITTATSASTATPDEAASEGSHHGPRIIMDGPTRLKTVGIAQKLGDLYHSIKQDQQAERYYLWSVEQLLKNHDQLERQIASSSTSGHANHDLEDAERLQNARDREAMKKQFNFDKLPSWMTKTDLGASLEALAGFYASKGVYSNALPLYMRALSLVDNKSCHAAVIM